MSFVMFLRTVLLFMLAALFKEGELSINKSSFNPLKVMLTFLLISYILFSVAFIYKLLNLYITMETHCPTITKQVINKNHLDDTFKCVFILE